MSTRRDHDDDRTTDITGVVPIAVSEESTARTGTAMRLVCVAGVDLGRTFRLTSGSTSIGRGTADVALQANDVSRHHARIVVRDLRFEVEDLGSANGTYLNGMKIEDRVTVRGGDRIQVGSTILVFAHHDELEDRMHQLQRLEALGTLAGGLAHDFNNALAVIMTSLDMFKSRLPPSGELREMAEEMGQAADSAAALVKRLLRLGRTEPLEFSTVMLAPLVQKAVSMMRRQLHKHMSINVDIPTELKLRGSSEELHQVLINLMLNARDAMPNGGTLRIEACSVVFDRSQAAAHHLPTKGEYLELTVEDSGVGMDEATLARAFDPFFTTKPPGQGTGLGLAMIHSIVRRHGGAVVAESELRRGTTFKIWLPSGLAEL